MRIRLRVPLVAVLLWGTAAAEPEPVELEPVQRLVEQHCLGCHSDAARLGDLSLQDLDAPAEHPQVWEKVLWKLRHRQMPPLGLPRPEESEYEAAVAALVASLDEAARQTPDPGRTDTFRRLTRFEYQNAVRDLLALEMDVDSLLPRDESSQGFDNITVANLSPTLLERYLSAANKVSRLAVGAPVAAPTGRTILLPVDLTQEERLEGLPFGTRGGALEKHTFPVDGEYEIQLRLTRNRNERVEGLSAPHQLELILDGRQLERFTVAPPPRGEPHHLVDRDLNARIRVQAGPHEIGAAFVEQTAALLETDRQPYLAHFNMDRHPRPQPALYSLTILGPFESSRPGATPSRRRIFVCQPERAAEEEACAMRILKTLMRRAYRRDVRPADLHAPMRFFREAREDADFEAGIETALRAILVSPHFLFRIEEAPTNVLPGGSYSVSDVDLASRLSFFLWSSIPDDELLDAATAGRLSEPLELESQVRRMLADPRSEALTKNFAAQWLYLRNLESIRPDPRQFPDFDDNLRQAMRRETELLFQSILREDRSVLDLLRADYTFLNERLAKHYGVPHIYGSRFRRVELGEAGVRGGLLSHASVLTVTSYANRTSPVIRGKWVLDNILGTPPPPPPPNVPQLEEKEQPGKKLSVRQLMALHRENPACATCHQVMDPVGFAFEHFDAIGRWRATVDGVEIDASGALPDGTRFSDLNDLQQALLRKPDLFATTLTNKLLTYALGRGVTPADAPAVRKAVSAASEDHYRLSTLLLEIVKSAPFRMRRIS